eukprot:296173-Rhodomonas_salina.1
MRRSAISATRSSHLPSPSSSSSPLFAPPLSSLLLPFAAARACHVASSIAFGQHECRHSPILRQTCALERRAVLENRPARSITRKGKGNRKRGPVQEHCPSLNCSGLAQVEKGNEEKHNARAQPNTRVNTIRPHTHTHTEQKKTPQTPPLSITRTPLLQRRQEDMRARAGNLGRRRRAADALGARGLEAGSRSTHACASLHAPLDAGTPATIAAARTSV